jgi:hypothetical protein
MYRRSPLQFQYFSISPTQFPFPLQRRCHGMTMNRVGNRRLTHGGQRAVSSSMTASLEMDLKQRLARLSEPDRRVMSAYLLRLKHQSKRGRQGVSKLMKEMDAGKKTGLSKLATGLGQA